MQQNFIWYSLNTSEMDIQEEYIEYLLQTNRNKCVNKNNGLVYDIVYVPSCMCFQPTLLYDTQGFYKHMETIVVLLHQKAMNPFLWRKKYVFVGTLNGAALSSFYNFLHINDFIFRKNICTLKYTVDRQKRKNSHGAQIFL